MVDKPIHMQDNALIMFKVQGPNNVVFNYGIEGYDTTRNLLHISPSYLPVVRTAEIHYDGVTPASEIRGVVKPVDDDSQYYPFQNTTMSHGPQHI